MVTTQELETKADQDAIWRALEEVKDPEVPVLSVLNLGVVRGVRLDGDDLEVTITPTYSGCPAMNMIEAQITEVLAAQGLSAGPGQDRVVAALDHRLDRPGRARQTQGVRHRAAGEGLEQQAGAVRRGAGRSPVRNAIPRTPK